MILTCFFHQTLNRYFSYIRNKEKKIRKIWPLKVYSNLKRMTGLVRLYAAVISSIPPSGQSNQHPYGLNNGWTWLSRMLNLEPRANYTAVALNEFLAVAGHALMRKYKKQFGKLLNTLVLDYVPKIEKVTDKAQSGPVVRLKVFLEACIKDQKIPVPDGYLAPHWWRSSSF